MCSYELSLVIVEFGGYYFFSKRVRIFPCGKKLAPGTSPLPHYKSHCFLCQALGLGKTLFLHFLSFFLDYFFHSLSMFFIFPQQNERVAFSKPFHHWLLQPSCEIQIVWQLYSKLLSLPFPKPTKFVLSLVSSS